MAVVQRAVDAQSHQCARVAEFAEAQTRRPSRRLVLVETQHDDGVEFDSDTDSVMGAWEDDDEDPAQEDARVDHNHENPLVPEVHPAVPAVIPNMVLSESANSMSDSEGPSEDVGFSEAGSFDVEENEVEPEAPFRLPGVAVLRAAFLLLDGVSLVEEMQDRACIMKSVPRFMRGNYRIAMRTALEEICAGERTREEARAAWVEVVHLAPKDVVAPPSKRRAHTTGQVD